MTSGPLFLGVDLGTSSLKCGLYDLSGRPRAAARVAYPTHEADGVAEQHAIDWWNALADGLHRVSVSVDRRHIAGIAVGGHAPSPVFVDTDLHPVFPVLPWFDRRATGEREQLIALVGHVPADGPQRLMSQLAARAMWHRTHAPQEFSRVRWILHSGDYLVARLTGQCLSTSPKVPILLTAAGLSPELLPDRVCTPGNVAGTLRRAIADEFGFQPDVPVIAGGLDSFLAAVGSGLSEPGDGCVTSGSATVVALMGGPGCEGRFAWNGLPLMSRPVSPGGRALRQARQAWGLDGSTPDAIRDAARLEPPSPTDRPFVDWAGSFARGEGLALPVPSAASSKQSPMVRFRWLLDEVLLGQRTVLEALERGQPATRLRAAGGLAVYAEFCQLQADVLGRRIDSLEVTESGSLGAAMLAATALGFHTPSSAASHMVRNALAYEPREDVSAFYERRFQNIHSALAPTGS